MQAQTDINTDYRCTSSIAKERRPKIQMIGVSSAGVDYARDAVTEAAPLETKKSCSPAQTSTQIIWMH
jgi:hypothetical protein